MEDFDVLFGLDAIYPNEWQNIPAPIKAAMSTFKALFKTQEKLLVEQKYELSVSEKRINSRIKALEDTLL